jgi:hypothetical protein
VLLALRLARVLLALRLAAAFRVVFRRHRLLYRREGAADWRRVGSAGRAELRFSP